MLRAAAASSPVSRSVLDTPDLVRWMSQTSSPKRIIRALPVAGAVAVGISIAWLEMNPRFGLAEERRLVARATAHVDHSAVALWRDIALLAATHDGLSAAGLSRRIAEHAAAHPGVWARSLEWLLVVGRELDGLDAALTMSLADRHGSVRAALERSTRSEVLEIRQRAEGIRALMQGAGPWEERLLEAFSTSLDARRHVFPRPLEAPSATWLASPDLEDQLRGVTSQALNAFKSYVHECGGLEEESLTATLLQYLVQFCAETAQVGRWAPVGLPQVQMASRQVPKKEEATNGADVGVVIDVHAAGHLRTRIADLVQVKKTHALIPSRRTDKSAWTVDRDQLRKLLSHSATAVYWLIEGDGSILVVPAKYLAGIAAATERQSPHLTVDRSQLRHVAVPLAHHLTDLMMGMWLGSGEESVLNAAEGNTPGVRPRHVLGITVTVPRLLDERPGRAMPRG